MVQITRPRGSLKNLQVDAGSDKMETFFAVALAVVIVGSLVLTIYFTFFRSAKGSRGSRAIRWQCSKCSNEFTVDKATEQKLSDMGKPMADCPKCGAKKSAYPMHKCYNPACGKYFVGESAKNPDKPTMDDVCPYCGVNWMKGVSDYAASKK
jgi:DNA-directed RNA polymerase subunit RPC12/RpoP